MSEPNSQPQVVHPDTPHKEEAILYTCFVALQDISIDMGPTTWLPRTDTQEMHERFQDESSTFTSTTTTTTTTDDDANVGTTTPKDQLLSSQPSVQGIFPKGSCIFLKHYCVGSTMPLVCLLCQWCSSAAICVIAKKSVREDSAIFCHVVVPFAPAEALRER
jgi:hypothetical protein